MKFPNKFIFSVFVLHATLIASRAEPTNSLNADKINIMKGSKLKHSIIIWGDKTNLNIGNVNYSGVLGALHPQLGTIRPGICTAFNNNPISICLDTNKASQLVYACFENLSTNSIAAYLPHFNERFEVSMIDSNGEFVPKTQKGLSVGQPTRLEPNIFWLRAKDHKYQGEFFLNPQFMILYAFNPREYFAVQRLGFYKLFLVQHIYAVETNTFLKAFTLPPVAIDVNVVN